MTSPTGQDRRSQSANEILFSLIFPIYLPALLVQTSVGMITTILPLYLDDAGLTYLPLSVVFAAAGVGSMLSQLPLGAVLAKTAERSIMLVSALVMGVSSGTLGLTAVAAVLILQRFVWGIGSAGWLLSRQTLLTREVPPSVRGRAMSLFGGVARLGLFLGALAGAFSAVETSFTTTFVLVGLLTLSAAVPLMLDRSLIGASAPPPSPQLGGLFTSFETHRRSLMVAGAGQVAIIMVRTGRYLVMPLIGLDLGLGLTQTGQLVAIGLLADLVLSPTAGIIMDRFGRLFSIVPSFCGMGFGFFMLAGADDHRSVVVAAIIIGLANAIGSGSMLTLASDLAPQDAPSQFLASLGTIRESGKIAGPVLVGALAEVAGLPTAAAVLGALAFGSTAIIVFGIGETRQVATSDRSETTSAD